MVHSRGDLVTALILFTLQIATPAKNNARPVYELINEQARMDDIRLSSVPAILPYGNPLAGNSAHNARLHASNQQAMFNAERIRQHKAQLQRLTQGPPIIDSYMKAYHESQESHQLALEEQQSPVKEVTTTQATSLRKPIRNRPTQIRQRMGNRDVSRSRIQRQEGKSRTTAVETEKTNRGKSVSERSRNHRSYSSVEYEQYLQSKLPLAYLTDTVPAESVTIKPNGNAGIDDEQDKESSNVHTTVIRGSKSYHSGNEINALESILKKQPVEQLSEFQTLINADKSHDDLHYSLKDLSDPEDRNPKYYNSAFEHVPSSYISTYTGKDHTPITEEIDDIENPTPYQNAFLIPEITTISPLSTVTNSYYNIEVASHTVSSILQPNKINEDLYQDINNKNAGESYINYNEGVQHLAEDGTGVSAYGDENLHYAANYEFGYRVRDPTSGNYFGQYETKAGEKTSGHYHVLLPDGRMQKVQYTAGPSGYHADISYDHLTS